MAGTRNVEQAPVRAALSYWQGLDVTGYEQPPDLLNAEYLKAVAAAGTSLVSVIGVSAADAVTLPNGATIPTGKTLVLADADGLTVGGLILPQKLHVPFFLAGAAPATAGNWGVVFFTANVACKVTACVERHATAGNDGGAVTIMLKKVASGTAAGSGTDCLSAGISLKGTADTNAAGTLHATAANYTLAAGDSLAWVLTGTPTAVAGAGATVTLQRV